MIYMNIVDRRFCSVMNEWEMYSMVNENYSLVKDFVFDARMRFFMRKSRVEIECRRTRLSTT